MKIQHTKIVESGSAITVEFLVSDAPTTETGEHVASRVQVAQDQNPEFVELQLAALRRAKALIDDQIQAIRRRLNP